MEIVCKEALNLEQVKGSINCSSQSLQCMENKLVDSREQLMQVLDNQHRMWFTQLSQQQQTKIVHKFSEIQSSHVSFKGKTETSGFSYANKTGKLGIAGNSKVYVNRTIKKEYFRDKKKNFQMSEKMQRPIETKTIPLYQESEYKPVYKKKGHGKSVSFPNYQKQESDSLIKNSTGQDVKQKTIPNETVTVYQGTRNRIKEKAVESSLEKGKKVSQSVQTAPPALRAATEVTQMIKNQFVSQVRKTEMQNEVREEAYRDDTFNYEQQPQMDGKKKIVVGSTLVLTAKAALAGVKYYYFVLGGIVLSAITYGTFAFLILYAASGLNTMWNAVGNMGQGTAKVSAEVEFYRPYLEIEASKYPGMTQLVDLMLALIMQEAGGEPWIGTMDGDIMQSSESAGYPGPGYLKGQASIAQGVKYLYGIFSKTGLIDDPYNLELTKISLQSYNFGVGFYDWFKGHGYTSWSFEIAVEYAKIGAAAMGWGIYRSNSMLITYAGPINYGDQRYPEHVLQYYDINVNIIPYAKGGLPIPMYYQWQYNNIAYGGGTIATSGCGPTSFAMVASYIKNETITPVDAVSWCGNSYYVPGAGTSWDYFAGAARHFGIKAPVQTSDMNSVMQALVAGKPVICSQGPGLFTSAGHFIVLRGVTSDGKVMVNDPNDNDNKNYNSRAFDMASEIHSTALNYWIFSK